jgi:membrane-associated phospholipid phosphatase
VAALNDRYGARPVNAVTRVFVVAMIVVTIASFDQVPSWPWLLVCDALALTLVSLVERAPRSGGFAGVVALWYPFLLIPAYYGQLGIIGVDVAHVRDLAVQRWEVALLGGQPSVAWHQAMPLPALSWVLHACYAAHYLIFIGVPVWLWLRVGRDEGERAVFTIALTFFVCFVGSALYPVAGPWYWFGPPTGPESQVATARLVDWLLDSGSSYGTAFPSSHVAASWVAVLVAIRRAPVLAAILAPVALGLAAGTVYGQFHYAVDAFAGAAVALACYACGDWLRTRLARPASPP